MHEQLTFLEETKPWGKDLEKIGKAHKKLFVENREIKNTMDMFLVIAEDIRDKTNALASVFTILATAAIGESDQKPAKKVTRETLP